MKENILTVTDPVELLDLDIEEKMRALIHLKNIGVTFIDRNTNKVIVDDLELDDCLEEYSHDNWEKIKKELINSAKNAIEITDDALRRSRYMQVCGDYLDSLEDAKDSLYQFIRDLESKTNQYCG